MGTRSAIAIQQGDGWKGRYAHWDGYPSAKLPALAALVERDGLETVIATLTQDHYGWSTLDPAQTDGPMEAGYSDGRFANVVGYGVAYTEANGVAADDWITHDGDDWGTEWAYVLTDAGVTIFERDYAGDRWVLWSFYGWGQDSASFVEQVAR